MNEPKRPLSEGGSAGRQPISQPDVEREKPGPVESLASEDAAALKRHRHEGNPDHPSEAMPDPAGEEGEEGPDVQADEPVTGGATKREREATKRSYLDTLR